MRVTTKVRRQTKQGRFYDIDGVGNLPSVTTILQAVAKPALVNWSARVERDLVCKVSADLYEDAPADPKLTRAAWTLTLTNRLGKEKAHQKELATAGEIGSQTHALIEWTLRKQLCAEPGPAPHVSDKAAYAFSVWQGWAQRTNLRPILIEQVVWSKTHGFAGTLDVLAEVDGKLTVLDWKTGKRCYAESHLQNAAYRRALREMGHSDPQQGLIVRLPKVEGDPDPEIVVAKDEHACMDTFLAAKKVWEWSQEMEEEG